MENYRKVAVPSGCLYMINQIFEIEKKVSMLQETHSIQRNLDKLKTLMEETLFATPEIKGLTYHNPIGEAYSDTRTDCEASISGTVDGHLVITEVIKPVIYCVYEEAGTTRKTIVQKAVVVAAAV